MMLNDKSLARHSVAVLVYGNHGHAPHQIEDYQTMIEDAFQDSGVRVRHSLDPVPGVLNIFLEFFIDEGYVLRMLEAKERDPNTEFICVGSEIVTGKTFNHFPKKVPAQEAVREKLKSVALAQWKNNYFVFGLKRLAKKILMTFTPGLYKRLRFGKWYVDVMAAQHSYSDLTYWKLRFDAFSRLAPHFKQIWCFADFLVPVYQEAFPSTPVRYAPIVTFQKQPLLQHRDEEKDIDFLFTGTMTEHRTALTDLLKARGYKVVVGSSSLSSFLRFHYLKRAKISLDMRQGSSWSAPSPMRLHKLLLSGSVVLAEKARESCLEEEFVNTFGAKDFLQKCEDELRQGAFSERGKQSFGRYLDGLNDRQKVMRDLVESALTLASPSSHQSRTRRLPDVTL